MTIRAATEADAAAIAELLRPVIRDTTITFTTIEKSEDSILADIAARGDGFQVAVLDGEVVGFATYFPFRAGPGYDRTQEHSVVLAPKAHGLGLGRALVSRIEEVAKSRGVHCLVAGVSGENAAGLAFHAAIGFEETTRLRDVGHKFDRYIDLVLMQKFL